MHTPMQNTHRYATRPTLLLSLIFAICTGCLTLSCTNSAPSASTEKQHTVVLWHAYRAQEEKALNQVVDAFNTSRTDLQIQALQIPSEAFADKLTAAIPRNNGPDIFLFAHDRIGDWAEAGLIEPVSYWASTEDLQNYLPTSVRALVYKQALYGLPIAFKSVVLFYNKNLVPTPPTTDEELLALALKHTHAKEKKYGLVYQNTSLYFTAPFIHGFGGNVLNERGDTVLIDKPGAVRGLQFARQLLDTHKVVPQDVSGNLVTTLFNTEKAAMVINGPWFRGEINKDLNWGVATLPTIVSTGKKAAPFVGSEAVLLSRYSTRKPAAYEAMKWLAGYESSKIRMKVAGQPAAHVRAWEDLPKNDPLTTFRDQLKHSVIMPGGPLMRAVWSPTDQAIIKVVKQGEDPTKVLPQARAKIERSVQ